MKKRLKNLFVDLGPSYNHQVRVTNIDMLTALTMDEVKKKRN